jgi:hypothetical protein
MRLTEAMEAGWFTDGDGVIQVPIDVWRRKAVSSATPHPMPNGNRPTDDTRGRYRTPMNRGQRLMTPLEVAACFIVGALAGSSFAAWFSGRRHR